MTKNVLRPVLMAFAITISLCFLIGASLSVAADATVVPGKIVVNHDEWTFTDLWGFGELPVDTSAFAVNVANWFTGGNPGDFLVYSADWGLTGESLEATMIAAGHQWTISTTVPDGDLIQYDAIFLAGPNKPNNTTLISYVNSGGNVYLAGGTGDFGGSNNEAAFWNGFLNQFNLNFLHSEGGPYDYNGVCYNLPVTSTHPIFAGVTQLYYNNGNSVNELDSTNPHTDILEFYGLKGLIGVFALVEIEVTIDIKPGSDPNCFNINGHGVIPVAILGSDELDVYDIDPDSLLFGGLAVRVRGNKGPLCHVEDTNSDDFPDLVCQFEDDSENWVEGNGTATLIGNLSDDSAIEGTDSICVVPPE